MSIARTLLTTVAALALLCTVPTHKGFGPHPAFGKDGAMYFITGGRGTQSGLYRVTYTGETARKRKSPASEGADLRALH